MILVGLILGLVAGAYLMGQRKDAEIARLEYQLLKTKRFTFDNDVVTVWYKNKTHEIPLHLVWEAFSRGDMQIMGLSLPDIVELRRWKRENMIHVCAKHGYRNCTGVPCPECAAKK